LRPNVSGVWKEPLPAECGTYLVPVEPCRYPYEGATLFPRGLVLTPPLKIPSVPWLPLSLELLEATSIKVVPTSLTECDYTASGVAMGPYPGTFTQTGVIKAGAFTGTATITSDVQTIQVDLSGALPDRPCALLLSGATVDAAYIANGPGLNEDGSDAWSDDGNVKVWLDPSRGSLVEAFLADAVLGSFQLPTPVCPPSGCT
jgi:hypothetical protein